MKRSLLPLFTLRCAWALLPLAALPAGLALPLAAQAQAQPTTPFTGRVTGPDGAGLPGVTVLLKGTTTGTATDAEGRFALAGPAGSTLVFSSVGFVRREVVPASGAAVNVQLTDDQKALDEVVVVGYGTQQRQAVTGAVSSVSAREIASQPVPDVSQALQGRAAGVTVTQNSGAPGGAGGTSVRVRGITSAGYNAPLYVVDGFPLPSSDENQLNVINPNDIESIDVLKDASATAIYGVRAANGVVLITTKRGKAGKTSFSFDTYRGIQQVWRKLKLLNAEEYAVINNENHINAGLLVLPKLQNPKALTTDTDWQSLIFRRAQQQNYAFTAAGGTDKARFSVSGGYFQQDGTIIGSHFERFTVRANGDLQINKMLKFGLSLSAAHVNDRQVNTSDEFNGIVSLALQAPPTIAPYTATGNYNVGNAALDNFIEPSPLPEALIDDKSFTRNRLISTLYAELEPLKGLRLRTSVGTDQTFDNSSYFRPTVVDIPRYSVSSASRGSNYAPSYLIENTATYDHIFAGKHHLTLLLGQSAQEFNFSTLGAGRVGYVREDLRELNSGPINTQLNNNGTSNQSRLASYFGRVNYEFAGKYLLSAVVRADGSSAFAPGRKFGVFPGVSAGWRISDEEFLKDNTTVSNLKLRAGYGRVGNPANAGAFAYLYTLNPAIQAVFGPSDGAVVNGSAPTRLPNNDLNWEINEQTNLGLDVGLLNNRLEGSLDLYYRNSPNLIAGVPVSAVSGTYEAINTNAASAYNKGLDLSLTSHNLVGSGLNWTTTLIFSTYKSRLSSLGSGLPYDGQTSRSGTIVRYDAGQPFGFFRGYVADGLFQTADEVGAHATQTGAAPGDIRFKDLNGDGVIDDKDRTNIGSPNPSFTYSVANTLTYKGFELTAFVQGSQGNSVYNLNRFYTEGGLYGNGNSSTRVLGRWTGAGTSNDVPRAIAADPNQNQRVSSYYVENGSYVRLKTLTLAYNFPASVLSHFSGQTLRVYVSGQNLLTLTKYSGYDPEIGAGGVDRGTYPQARILLAGLSIGF
ncbi:MAG: SusC/RagA family TonB-linked outer membrane protein [Janthinobacterium lividum]